MLCVYPRIGCLVENSGMIHKTGTKPDTLVPVEAVQAICPKCIDHTSFHVSPRLPSIVISKIATTYQKCHTYDLYYWSSICTSFQCICKSLFNAFFSQLAPHVVHGLSMGSACMSCWPTEEKPANNIDQSNTWGNPPTDWGWQRSRCLQLPNSGEVLHKSATVVSSKVEIEIAFYLAQGRENHAIWFWISWPLPMLRLKKICFFFSTPSGYE